MVKRVQHIRHNNTQADLFTGLEGEFTYDVTNKEIRAHDGETAGGIPTARKDLNNVAAATTSVAGKMAATDKQKLDGIEAGAQVNPDAAAIKTAYESNGDTNAFTDTHKQDVETDLPAAIAANASDISDNAAANAATQSDLDAEEALNASHRSNTSNPHGVTKTQIGLGSTADGAEINPPPITAAEITAGSVTAERTAIPKEIKDAIDALLQTVVSPILVLSFTGDATPVVTEYANNGLGTISVVRNSIGNYTLSWVNALDTPLHVVACSRENSEISTPGTETSTSIQFDCRTLGDALTDPSKTTVIIYGDLA